jgi:hypothetical protein
MKTPTKKATSPVEPVPLDPSKILVRAMKGYLYSPVTKRLYYTHNREEVGPSTYERPWSVNIGYGFEQPVYPLNPVDYCTPATADAVLTWAMSQWQSLLFDIVVPTPDGFVTAPQHWLVVTNGQDLYEIYSAGWWAFDYDKDGAAAAFEQRTAELRDAGFSV